MEKEQKKQSGFNSILFRSWVSFVVLAIGIILAVWVGELVVFSAFYDKMRTDNVVATNQELIQTLVNNGCDCDAPAFRFEAESASREARMSVIVFEVKDGDAMTAGNARINFVQNENSDMTFGAARALLTEKFLKSMAANDGKPFFYEENDGNLFNVIYGQKLINPHGSAVYYFSSTAVNPKDEAVVVLTSQFKAVTVVCLLVAVLVSFLIAWRFSKPIREFTATAKKIGDGDLTVKYVGNGYNEFDDLADALNYSTAEIIKAENLRRDFLANVSHDLRTPLTLVKAYAEMIRDISGDNKEKRVKNTQIIINEVDRLTMLVDDILDLSKLEAGTAEIKTEPLNISQTTERVLEQFDVMKEKGYKIVADIEADVWAECDYKRLTQIIYNLVGNALNYVGEDMTVLVRVKRVEDRARMEIIDHGKGIAKDEIDKVWDRYYRANQKKRGVVGSGIGLSIVKQIFVGLKARYGVDSVEGEGSTFWFELTAIDAPENN